MPVQQDPICFSCQEPITRGQEPVFAAPCDHDHHPSVVFHPLCLMDHRENRERMLKERERFLANHTVTHYVEVEHLHGDED